MTSQDLIDELRRRLVAAKQFKNQAYDTYSAATVSAPDKWKLKVQWRNACKRVRDLSGAIATIATEGLGK